MRLKGVLNKIIHNENIVALVISCFVSLKAIYKKKGVSHIVCPLLSNSNLQKNVVANVVFIFYPKKLFTRNVVLFFRCYQKVIYQKNVVANLAFAL